MQGPRVRNTRLGVPGAAVVRAVEPRVVRVAPGGSEAFDAVA